MRIGRYEPTITELGVIALLGVVATTSLLGRIYSTREPSRETQSELIRKAEYFKGDTNSVENYLIE
jgi:hypothetical protein